MSARARSLRRRATEAERLLWAHIRGRRFARKKFRRQHEICGFVVDFVALDAKLVIEVDGGQHATQMAEDAGRTEILEKSGFHVVRFWNNEVMGNIDGVLEAIIQELHLVR